MYATLNNGDDAPSIGEWLSGGNGRTLSTEAIRKTDVQIRTMACKAANHFYRLRSRVSLVQLNIVAVRAEHFLNIVARLFIRDGFD